MLFFHIQVRTIGTIIFKTQTYILMVIFCTCFEKTIKKYLDLYSDNSDFVDQLIENFLKELDQNFVFADEELAQTGFVAVEQLAQTGFVAVEQLSQTGFVAVEQLAQTDSVAVEQLAQTGFVAVDLLTQTGFDQVDLLTQTGFVVKLQTVLG